MNKESSYPVDWFKKAEQDLRRTELRIKEDDFEDAAFHLQQSIEKYLKGYLISKGWKLEKVHDLEYLLDEAIKFDQKFEEYRTLCQGVTGYYLVARYPFFHEAPGFEEIKENLAVAKRFAKFVATKIEI